MNDEWDLLQKQAFREAMEMRARAKPADLPPPPPLTVHGRTPPSPAVKATDDDRLLILLLILLLAQNDANPELLAALLYLIV